MTDPSFDLITKSSGALQLPYNVANPTIWTRGQTATFTFEFGDSVTTQFNSDYTIQGTESFGTVIVPSGVTLTIPSGTTLNVDSIVVNGTLDEQGTLNSANGSLFSLNEFVEWGGSYTTQTMLNSVEKYRLQIPDSVGIDSLVVGVEPSQELQDRGIVGVWGLVDRVRNERNQALTTNRYGVEITVLAPIDEYATVSDVETDLLI